MDLSISISLLKNIWEFIQKPFIQKAYEVSTSYKNYREAFASPLHKLENIEYEIIWQEYYLGKKMTIPMFWVRAKEGKEFSKMVISVQAILDEKISYQDNLTLLDVTNVPTQTALPSIPFRKLEVKRGKIYQPYEYLQIEIIEAYDKEGKEDDSQCKKSSHITPFDKLEITLGLEKGYVEKWDKIYNLEFIEMEIKEEQIRLIGCILNRSYNMRKYLFSKKWLVKTIFWYKNIFTARQLTREFNKYIKEQKDFRGDNYLKRY